MRAARPCVNPGLEYPGLHRQQGCGRCDPSTLQDGSFFLPPTRTRGPIPAPLNCPARNHIPSDTALSRGTLGGVSNGPFSFWDNSQALVAYC